jgi:hypothetical protein
MSFRKLCSNIALYLVGTVIGLVYLLAFVPFEVIFTYVHRYLSNHHSARPVMSLGLRAEMLFVAVGLVLPMAIWSVIYFIAT